LLREAEALLSHQVDTGDIAGVIHTALDLLVVTLRRRKFAATTRPHRVRCKPGSPRHIPASVKRAVWERDGGQCTFVSTAGKRCDSRARLEFDHAQEVARGGQATAANIRLRCRAHNQYAAECTFGTEFMRQKRAAAQRAAAATRQRASEVIPWLRQLGFRETEARRAAAHCESIPDAPLEKRVHTALRFLAPGGVRHG